MAPRTGEKEAAGTRKCIITLRGGLRLQAASLCPDQERIIDWKIRHFISITGNSNVFVVWCINAATTMMGTACCWMMAGSLASASRAFPGHWSANTFGPQFCRWTGSWKRCCSTRGTANAAAGVGHCSDHAPTEGNTVPIAPLSFTASRRPRANGGAGRSVDN